MTACNCKLAIAIIAGCIKKLVGVGSPLNDYDSARLARVEMLASLMDDAFRIPGTNIRLGWDSIIGLIPGVGDLVSLGSNAYLIWESRRLGIRKRAYVKMMGNATVDFFIGVVPVAGDVLDVFWKSHRRNVKVIRAELARLRESDRNRF